MPVPINHVVVDRARETRKRKPVMCQIDTSVKLPPVTAHDIEKLQKASDTPLQFLLSPLKTNSKHKAGTCPKTLSSPFHRKNQYLVSIEEIMKTLPEKGSNQRNPNR
ncbi:hypothetical protein DPMN_140471 [Dreissena polymorpha]|uniref:Uncharacterized protein n=1 Tax=Dreissena polymorpha TaxID=45954 RepID=A0A9D4G7N4_DREPO|nr:hypothetical protein DPMN_140471 [Dreissena polymorpha]